MKIHFEGFEMKFLRTELIHEFPDFYFDHGGIHLHLSYREQFGWRICIGNTLKKTPELRKTEFYQFVRQEYETQQELGQKMIRYLVSESPMRLQLLFNFGYDLLEKTTKKAKI